ncbi:BamA/TamA family outer membrane protein [Croceimicrobium hydrocarbonivorans]|uniref:BamA/TamA family outer membrane protein n=1 Tax=Croceimicrobium hydrocarbonivorans TaxID=2761580 RepID=A0A7H0VFK6_9FLAO|nr:BamA/TamA family outer membrane protein [Croceimicrobium hydrocarbonivorans]QNR24504.1 BamA/TamA family outer membrane protein [Croceimicrobium hydrocarbonivorans]
MAGRLLSIFVLFMLSLVLKAQDYSVISPKASWTRELEQTLQDSLNPTQLRWKIQEAGFWLHYWKGDSLYSGNKLEIGELKILNGSDSLDYKHPDALALNDSNFRIVLSRKLRQQSNLGYPFAAFRLMDYQVIDDHLNARLQLDSGPFIQFDSIVVLGYDDIHLPLLYQEINWQKASPYSDLYLQNLQDYIGRTAYLQMERAPAVAFFPNKARLYLYLKKRSSNLINGVLGLNTDDEGNTQLTGDFQLKLLNLFNRGEGIELRWQSPGAQAQEFELGFRYPYLFNSPLGLAAQIEIFRQDSSFVRQEFNLNLPYRLAQAAHFSLGLTYFSSEPLGIADDSRLIKSVQTLRFNLGFDIDRRNDAIVARKGYALELSLGSGQRQSEGVESRQFAWHSNFQYFAPYKRWVWHQEIQSAGLSGPNLQDNEVFRLGGLRSLRGFNEWTFFSPAYGILRSELRYMLGSYDYLSAFADLGFAERQALNRGLWDRHSGIGLGLNFQTKGGIFSLFLAVGQSNLDSYDFRAGKIHLAYVNRF